MGLSNNPIAIASARVRGYIMGVASRTYVEVTTKPENQKTKKLRKTKMTMTARRVLGFCVFLTSCTLALGGSELPNNALTCRAREEQEETGECSITPTTSPRVSPADVVPHRMPPSTLKDFRFHSNLVSSNDPDCIDQNAHNCQGWALMDACAKRPGKMLVECPYSCGLCNNLLVDNNQVRTCYGKVQNAREPSTLAHIQTMQDYMIRTVYADDDEQYGRVRVQVSNAS